MNQKLIPTIYFYLLSAIGMMLLIMGLFNSVHYIVGITAYDKYPLRYGAESRCEFIPKMVPDINQQSVQSEKEQKDECLKNLEKERINTKIDDLEKSIAFTIIGILIFGIHFYFARKEKKS